MTIKEAEKIGSRQGLIASGIGLVIADLMMILIHLQDHNIINSIFWLVKFEYWINVTLGVIIMLMCGYCFGQIAGKLILIKKWNYILTGMSIGIIVLLTTSFLASLTGFFQEGLSNISSPDNPFYDYIFKPMYWVVSFGFIPVLIVGFWFGKQIKNKGIKNKSETAV